jgi:molecular chaperone IbpA
MTQKRLTTQNLMDLWPHANAIGFDSLFDNLHHSSRMGTYPPYNIVRVDEDTYRIEIALAGFTRDDIEIIHEKNILAIRGETHSAEAEESSEDYIHKGISSKSFERAFTLGEYIEVTDASMENGLLYITCETIVPEEMQAKTIKIS